MPPRLDLRTDEPADQAALLIEDPDLALGVPVDERAMAERAVLVTLLRAGPGPLALDDDRGEPTLGILVLEGFVTATTVFAGQSTAQLLGPGHIVLTGGDLEGLLPVQGTHEAISDVRLAVLDRRFIAAVRRWPGLLIALHERLRFQQRQLAVHAAIGRLRRNEDRLLAVLWQLAEEWGHVTKDGITVPIRLTHDSLGRLAGASRPTTSLALTALEAEGRLKRSAHGDLILDPDSSMILKRATAHSPRRLASDQAPRPIPPRHRVDQAALLARVAALQDAFEEKVRTSDQILGSARAAAGRSAETRRQLRSERDTS